MTSSGCQPDQAFLVLLLESEEQCSNYCDVYADNGLGCTFSAWTPRDDANCLLFDQSFGEFLSHCDRIGGARNISSTGCDVDNPEDHSCDGFRWLN